MTLKMMTRIMKKEAWTKKMKGAILFVILILHIFRRKWKAKARVNQAA